MEPFADLLVARGSRVEVVVEAAGVVDSEQLEAVDEVQVRVAGIASRGDDFRRQLANSAQRQRADRQFLGPRRRAEASIAPEDGRARVVLDARAEDGRREHDRDCGVPVADGVEEAVQRGTERALAHRVAVDDVDAGLDADQIRGNLADRPGDGLVEHALPGEREVVQVDVCESSRDGRPRLGGSQGLQTMTDRAAVVDPSPPGRIGCRHYRALGDA